MTGLTAFVPAEKGLQRRAHQSDRQASQRHDLQRDFVRRVWSYSDRYPDLEAEVTQSTAQVGQSPVLNLTETSSPAKWSMLRFSF
jgi:hypothetical protein